jgi:hypothetical protein
MVLVRSTVQGLYLHHTQDYMYGMLPYRTVPHRTAVTRYGIAELDNMVNMVPYSAAGNGLLDLDFWKMGVPMAVVTLGK